MQSIGHNYRPILTPLTPPSPVSPHVLLPVRLPISSRVPAGPSVCVMLVPVRHRVLGLHRAGAPATIHSKILDRLASYNAM